MSRIRSIHPGIFTDEAWASVPIQARWLAMGLLTEADDNGVFEWKPLQIKMRIFPADNLDVSELLNTLIDGGILKRYRSGSGRQLCAIRNFCRYQKPRKPKAWFETTPEILEYVGLNEPDAQSQDDDLFAGESEPYASEPARVPQKSGIAPQREDGGGMRDDEGWRREEGESPIIPFEPPEPEWTEFIAFRKRIRAPFTDHAKKLAINELRKITEAGGDPRQSINNSIMNGWKGLFMPKEEHHARNGSHARGSGNGMLDAIFERQGVGTTRGTGQS